MDNGSIQLFLLPQSTPSSIESGVCYQTHSDRNANSVPAGSALVSQTNPLIFKRYFFVFHVDVRIVHGFMVNQRTAREEGLDSLFGYHIVTSCSRNEQRW